MHSSTPLAIVILRATNIVDSSLTLNIMLGGIFVVSAIVTTTFNTKPPFHKFQRSTWGATYIRTNIYKYVLIALASF